MRTVVFAAALLSVVPIPSKTTSSRSDLPLAGYEDNRRAAGTRHGDTLDVALDVQQVRWKPYGDRGGTITAFTFVERGRPARVPGPMIRVPSGTVINATLRNQLNFPAVVIGLQNHPSGLLPDSVRLAAGAERTVTFTVTAPGSYYYWGRTRSRPAADTAKSPLGTRVSLYPGGPNDDGPFVGAFIVDKVGEGPARNERVFLLTRWFDARYPKIDTAGSWKIMVNGASWPSTERLEYQVGDSVRWRVLNPMAIYHPMHLHGFYFNVTARGDGRLDTLYTPEQRRTVVTELMSDFSTMSLEWVPERAGNWLFHCHLIRHMGMPQFIDDTSTTASGAAHHASTAESHAEDHMAGLVMGILVRPGVGQAGSAMLSRATGNEPPARADHAMRLIATTRDNVFGNAPAYSFILQNGAQQPASDSIRFPGSTLTLVRGEPTRITVVNRTKAPLAVHWHGMEIESWFDGVGGWSGAGMSVRPPIAVGDSFMVRMTPKRAGTFIYHTHDETGDQLAGGLYGALLVLDPKTTRDTTRDHLVVLGQRGRSSTASLSVNGEATPTPLALTAGVANRLRFVSIPANEVVLTMLMRGTEVGEWTPVAVDGAELPPKQQVKQRAQFTSSAGQTFDRQVQLDSAQLASGQYSLRFITSFYPASVRLPDTTFVPLTRRR